MEIQIRKGNQEIYLGDADEWLFNNSCDSELECVLNELEQSNLNSIEFYCEETDENYTIEKLLSLIYD